MRNIIYILSIMFFLISCKNDFKKNSSKPTEFIDLDSRFKKWLNGLGLNHESIIDTTKERAFELWAYWNELTQSDSAFYWYPSKDSSFYLITNFNRKTKKRISSKYSNNIDLRFLKKSNNKVYIGLMLLDSLAQRSVDFYWYDSTSIFIIENLDKNGETNLMKLKMGIDSLWTYKIKK